MMNSCKLPSTFTPRLPTMGVCTPEAVIGYTSLFIVLFGNVSFFTNVVTMAFPFTLENSLFILSLALVLWAFIATLITLLSSGYLLKPALIFLLILTSFTGYFMDTYGIVIDTTMIRNTLETNSTETIDLITGKMLMYICFIGLLPSLLIIRVPIYQYALKVGLIRKTKSILINLCIILVLLLCFSKFYVSFLREYKPLRYYTNPTYPIYSMGEFVGELFGGQQFPFEQIGMDAELLPVNNNKKLLVVVVGEAARADHFSINGYNRETNPLLQHEELINYPQFYSCDTSTATSVPCMFSSLQRTEFNVERARRMDNVLDIAKRTGVNVLWRDNNSDSKGVAARVPYVDYRNPDVNPHCEGECRDTGMLVGLQSYVDYHNDNNIVIVLHQMGTHGPAYYKRYPKSFEQYVPICDSNQLEKCSREAIGNTYDNALLYTDFFLNEVIAFLKQNDSNYETSMIYMSDHGESLGEYGVYLHGMPRIIAPEAQIHIPAFIWLGQKSKENYDLASMEMKAAKKQSHDSLFHSILGFLNIETSIYNPQLDLFR